MGVDFEDYNNDGWLDLVVTNFSDDYNTLYRNTGKGFYVVGSKLYDPNGQEFRIRGVNRNHWDSYGTPTGLPLSGSGWKKGTGAMLDGGDAGSLL